MAGSSPATRTARLEQVVDEQASRGEEATVILERAEGHPVVGCQNRPVIVRSPWELEAGHEREHASPGVIPRPLHDPSDRHDLNGRGGNCLVRDGRGGDPPLDETRIDAVHAAAEHRREAREEPVDEPEGPAHGHDVARVGLQPVGAKEDGVTE